MSAWERFYRNEEVQSICEEYDSFGFADREVDEVHVTVQDKPDGTLLVSAQHSEAFMRHESAICDRPRLAETIRVLVRQVEVGHERKEKVG